MRLHKPARFVAPSGSVRVDRDGLPFYVFDSLDGKPFYFTLPPGDYSVQGGLMLGPIRSVRRKRSARIACPLPRKVRLIFGTNPNKCSIDLRRGLILCDHSLKALPGFALTFVLFHEIGHYFYSDEGACDRFAARRMMEEGYNPSQIYAAANFTMHHANERRGGVEEFARNLQNTLHR